VLDPVLVATSGDALASPDLAKAIHDELFPLASLITPNLPEAAIFSDSDALDSAESIEACARKLHAQGARAVLIKGGHCHGEVSEDIFFDGASFQSFSAPRLKTDNTHGTGCTLAAAIAAGLAQGAPLALAISQAKLYLTGALNAAARLNVGGLATSPANKGHGPLNHFFAFDKGTP
jgi:hydroxymethylpyrimidine kinase/phosphomethylpyrimidine kinase